MGSTAIEEGSLRHRLKTGTKEIHDVADTCMRSFLLDEQPASTGYEAYKFYVLQVLCDKWKLRSMIWRGNSTFHAVFSSQIQKLYEVLEEELERNNSHAVVGAIHFPQELNRSHLIARDLDYFFSGNWRDSSDELLTSAMRRYVERVRHVGSERPQLLLAHSYARYFGDMSGGQILRRLIKKRYSLPDDCGQQFYTFENIKSINDLKALYTARMNELPLSEEEVQALVDEASLIFRMNIDVFNEIAARFEPKASAADASVEESSEEQVRKLICPLKKLLNVESFNWDAATRMVPYVIGMSASAVALAYAVRR